MGRNEEREPMRRSVLSELREFIRSVIEEGLGVANHIFGPPDSPNWFPNAQNMSMANSSGVVRWEASFLVKNDKKKVVGRGFREGEKAALTKNWRWNPARTRRLSGLDELDAALYSDTKRGKKGAVVFAHRGKLSPEEKELVTRHNSHVISPEDQRAGALNFSGASVEKMTDGDWLLRGQWEEVTGPAPSVGGRSSGISPIVSRAAGERLAAKNAPSGPSSVSVVRRRRDEETGEITSITPVRGRR
jgi:hypothetical protein